MPSKTARARAARCSRSRFQSVPALRSLRSVKEAYSGDRRSISVPAFSHSLADTSRVGASPSVQSFINRTRAKAQSRNLPAVSTLRRPCAQEWRRQFGRPTPLASAAISHEYAVLVGHGQRREIPLPEALAKVSLYGLAHRVERKPIPEHRKRVLNNPPCLTNE